MAHTEVRAVAEASTVSSGVCGVSVDVEPIGGGEEGGVTVRGAEDAHELVSLSDLRVGEVEVTGRRASLFGPVWLVLALAALGVALRDPRHARR